MRLNGKQGVPRAVVTTKQLQAVARRTIESDSESAVLDNYGSRDKAFGKLSALAKAAEKVRAELG